MGAKITIDSASLMNKGLEVLEAHHLFDVDVDDVSVLVQRQSMIHSMVEFSDGVVKAQLGPSDMRIPIQYALSYPERWESPVERVDYRGVPDFTFDFADEDTFGCLALAKEAGREGGTMPCAMNAANEVANLAFSEGRCGFFDIEGGRGPVMERDRGRPSGVPATARGGRRTLPRARHVVPGRGQPLMGVVSAVFWGVVVLSLLVFLHEGGHFLAARAFGVRVTEFYLGMPCRHHLARKSRTYGTEFGVTPILLGGYTRICGMEGTHDDLLPDCFGIVQREGRVLASDVAAELDVDAERAYDMLATLADWAAIRPYYDAEKGEAPSQRDCPRPSRPSAATPTC